MIGWELIYIAHIKNNKWLIIIAMLTIVPIAGEIQFYPFTGSFRISFGTPVFLFFLLYFRQLPPRFSGILVGLVVVSFRVILDLIAGIDIQLALAAHAAVFFYYFSYGWIFTILNIRKYYQAPLLIGLSACGLEVISSMIEITFRYIFTDIAISLLGFFTILVIAVIRSFFVMGFFTIIMYHDLKIQEKEQREKNEQILLIVSNLYVETIQLKKTITTAETVTRDCYHLYRELKELNLDEQGKRALKISGDIHECKKDNQRIYAGLSRLMQNQNPTDDLEIDEIMTMIVNTNEKYASHLGKKIEFKIDIKGKHTRYQAYFVLSILNNLVANSVEAIKIEGIIFLRSIVSPETDKITFFVIDNGPGIQTKKNEIIFTPGYTSKYNLDGIPSNGIGLSYVKGAIEDGGGTIQLIESIPDEATIFKIEVPIQACVNKGDEN
ncbi:ATP-binding protein [Bacillaceae bacterium IKA-2]|nr:ATP-binding protein [Bacillaceae bacterium IKA-2]